MLIGIVAGAIAVVMVKSAVFLLLLSFKGLIVIAVLAIAFVLFRGPRDR